MTELTHFFDVSINRSVQILIFRFIRVPSTLMMNNQVK